MSVSETDYGALAAPARRGFAQALREIQRLLAKGQSVELYGAAGALGAAFAAKLAGPQTLLYVVADEETAEARAARPAVLLAAVARRRRPAGAAGRAGASGPRFVALRRHAARPAHDAAAHGGAVPAVAGVRAARAS